MALFENKTFFEIRKKIASNSLSNAVNWARALKMLESEETILCIDLKYMNDFLLAAAYTSGEARWNFMVSVGVKHTLTGKPHTLDGDVSYQPEIKFEQFDLDTHWTHTEENPTYDGKVLSDAFKFGILKLKSMCKKMFHIKDLLRNLTKHKKLLKWKQKFFRYMYNSNVEEMEKYHLKISEFESAELDWRTENDAAGNPVYIQYHQVPDNESNITDLQLGVDGIVAAEKSEEVDGGGSIKEYADRMMEAYKFRVEQIENIKRLNAVPDEDKFSLRYKCEEHEIGTRENPPLM
tara:strand:+ start:607 stop:1482 length:876 start_codon:yes stop_codon:yes gene_type:complete